MGLFDAFKDAAEWTGGAVADAGEFMGTEVLTPKNVLTAAGTVGGTMIGQPHLGAAAGRSLGEATFGDDWGWRGDDAAQGVGDVAMAGAKGYGFSQLGSAAYGGAKDLLGSGGKAAMEAGGSGAVRDAAMRGTSEAANQSLVGVSEGATEAAAQQAAGAGGGVSPSLTQAGQQFMGPADMGVDVAGGAAQGAGQGVASTAAQGAADTGGGFFGDMGPLEKAYMGAQGLSGLANIYGSYQQGRHQDKLREERAEMVDAMMPYFQHRISRMGGLGD